MSWNTDIALTPFRRKPGTVVIIAITISVSSWTCAWWDVIASRIVTQQAQVSRHGVLVDTEWSVRP